MTSAFRRARTTPWWRSMPCGTWPGWGWASSTYNWMEFGFGRTSTTSTAEATPRNLLGFKDGTRNIKSQETDLLERLRLGRQRSGPALDERRKLPGDPPHPDVHRELGPRLPRRSAERHRSGQGHRGSVERRNRVHHARTSRPTTTRVSSSSRPRPISGWPATRRTTGPAFCVAATPSPTASTRSSGRCSVGCSSSPS